MRFSRALIPTLRETPAEAEVVSHQLLLRGGFIRQVARGIYTYLPLGWRVLLKVTHIVREELTRAGCEEVQMPCLVPAELWQQSGRWGAYGKELLRIKDRHDREFCFGPTHEEVITELVAASVRSYRDLPKNLFQIHTKFRDEVRPRFGLMRGREFIMKDGYSFHTSLDDLDREYAAMRAAYLRIFHRCGLSARVVEAATGNIGGSSSHEVMILAETGESAIAHCPQCEYAANVELAAYRVPATATGTQADVPSAHEVHTPGRGGVQDVIGVLGVTAAQMIKTLIYERDGGIVVALVPGDREVNEHKLQTATGATFLELAGPKTIHDLTNAAVGFAGPMGLPATLPDWGPVTVLADHAIAQLPWGATGANRTDYHCMHVVPGRDFTPTQYLDLGTARADDWCPRCETGTLAIIRGIEVGHIFKLGTKYAEPLGARYLDHEGHEQTMIMGTYGLGIGRTAAAAVEQHHDARGIVWPLPIAPFHIALLLLNAKDAAHTAYAEQTYATLTAAGLDVLFDDRSERAGVKFTDAELIGLPYQVIIGGKGIAQQAVELKDRRTGEAQMMPVEAVVRRIQEELAATGGTA
ncbi:MAG: proline--tRNA ligase [Deltaproteobacteria bacterium]|nr:proline--tRNA ligase [Deltaproteobacteria bacterium]